MRVDRDIYPRTVAIRRPRGGAAPDSSTGPQVGDIGYSGQDWSAAPNDPEGEDEILSGVPASIQFQSPVSRNGDGVPTDAHAPNVWSIFVPKDAIALGGIKARDVIIDDLGTRYQVIAPYWSPLGYKVRAEEEERSS